MDSKYSVNMLKLTMALTSIIFLEMIVTLRGQLSTGPIAKTSWLQKFMNLFPPT